jgi:hypothetical protein
MFCLIQIFVRIKNVNLLIISRVYYLLKIIDHIMGINFIREYKWKSISMVYLKNNDIFWLWVFIFIQY